MKHSKINRLEANTQLLFHKILLQIDKLTLLRWKIRTDFSFNK